MHITFAPDADDMMLTMIDGLLTSGIYVKITYAMPPTRAIYQVQGVIKSRNDDGLIIEDYNSISGDTEETRISFANIAQIEVQ